MLKYIAGPAVGAVIGYCTNYIAVKMLFRPRREIKVFGKRLPLTPGAIPKGKPRLAKAAGEIVGNTLVTCEDIEKQLLSDEVVSVVSEKVMTLLSADVKSMITALAGSEAEYAKLRGQAEQVICDQIIASVSEVQLGNLIADKGSMVIKEKISGTMLKMFISDDLIQSIVPPIGMEIEEYVMQNGGELIEPVLERKLSELEAMPVEKVLESVRVDREKVKEFVVNSYQNLVRNNVSRMLSKIDLKKIVSDKINAMEVEELEQLVLKVMKKELNTIVNLGALIGLILGIINIFI